MTQNADFIEISGIKAPEDLQELKELIRRKPQTQITVCLDHPDTREDLELILPECDGITLARNWLVRFSPDKYSPHIQKDIIRQCKERGKVVFAKGQLLESALSNQKLSFAEASDITVLVESGCDGLIMERAFAIERNQSGIVNQLSSLLM